MNNTKNIELLNEITKVMKECGQLIMNADRSEAMVDEKAGHANFVTTYDKMIESITKEMEEVSEAITSIED